MKNIYFRVVELRSRYQKNFQLIIISHDEKFLQKLADLNNHKQFHELYRKQKYMLYKNIFCYIKIRLRYKIVGYNEL